MFLDSPFERCELCKSYVLLDQTQAQCAHEHNCRVPQCPLRRYFSEIEVDPDKENQGKEAAARDREDAG